jgi:leader peptidase (prepilin peptidase)/N-methyltransferase
MDPNPLANVTEAEPRKSVTTSSPAVIAVIAAVISLLGVVALVRHTGWTTLVVLQAVVFLVVATVIDLRELRIPNRLNLGFALLSSLSVLIAGVATEDMGSVGRAILAGFVAFAAFLALHILSPGGLGGGDVKLAYGIGVTLGWFSWSTLLWGLMIAAVLNGVAAVALAILLRSRRAELPFGPSLAVGAMAALAFVA